MINKVERHYAEVMKSNDDTTAECLFFPRLDEMPSFVVELVYSLLTIIGLVRAESYDEIQETVDMACSRVDYTVVLAHSRMMQVMIRGNHKPISTEDALIAHQRAVELMSCLNTAYLDHQEIIDGPTLRNSLYRDQTLASMNKIAMSLFDGLSNYFS